MKKLDLAKIQPLINMAVKEDFGAGDPTSRITVADDITATARIITREEIVVCGMEVIREVLRKYDNKLKLRVFIRDGKRANVANKLATIAGPLRSMLSAERVVLNFLQRLCGISTTTWKFVNAVRGTRARLEAAT